MFVRTNEYINEWCKEGKTDEEIKERRKGGRKIFLVLICFVRDLELKSKRVGQWLAVPSFNQGVGGSMCP